MSFDIFCPNCGAPSNPSVGVCPYCKTSIDNPNKKDKDGHLLNHLKKKYKEGDYAFVLRNADQLIHSKPKLKENVNFLMVYIEALIESDGPPSKIKTLLSHLFLKDPTNSKALAINEIMDAKAYLSNQRNDAGEKQIQAALKLYPDLAYGHFLLGSHIYHMDGEPHSAMIHLEKAIKIHPCFTRAWVYRGRGQ